MRKCRLIKRITDEEGTPTTRVVYTGTQRTYMERMMKFLIAKGEDVFIECDPPQKRASSRIPSQITGSTSVKRSMKF